MVSCVGMEDMTIGMSCRYYGRGGWRYRTATDELAASIFGVGGDGGPQDGRPGDGYCSSERGSISDVFDCRFVDQKRLSRSDWEQLFFEGVCDCRGVPGRGARVGYSLSFVSSCRSFLTTSDSDCCSYARY